MPGLLHVGDNVRLHREESLYYHILDSLEDSHEVYAQSLVLGSELLETPFGRVGTVITL